MATKKKGILSRSGEWWKHMKWMKRVFWHRERQAVKKDIKSQTDPYQSQADPYHYIDKDTMI